MEKAYLHVFTFVGTNQKIAIFYNPESGRAMSQESFYALVMKYMRDSGIVVLNKKTSIKRLISVRWKNGVRTFIAAGGDGTASAVASAIIELKIDAKFGVIPLGTLNHFSRDIGMPLSVPKSLSIIAKGKSMYIDVAKVNNQYFLNNSSLGFYPFIVSERDAVKRKRLAKWFRLSMAGIKAFRQYPHVNVEFESGGKRFRRKTPFVFVGNNMYELRTGKVGTRQSLDQGKLSVFIAHEVSRLRIILLAIHTLRGALTEQRDIERIGLSKLTIKSPNRKRLKVSFDGEVRHMRAPIRYSIQSRALRAIIP